MQLSPDARILWQWGPLELNATVVFTWATMAVLVLGSRWITRSLGTETPSRMQLLLEVLVLQIRRQIAEATQDDPDRYVPFIGTLFVFIAASTFLSVVPGVDAPAASLSTAAALALCVFFAVPAYGVAARGLSGYLRNYVRPTIFMLPFHLIGEISRTLALAIRLFGNLMSGRLVVAILLSVAPIFFPFVMEAFGLLIGLIQAYVFAVLAMVYIASATRASAPLDEPNTPEWTAGGQSEP